MPLVQLAAALVGGGQVCRPLVTSIDENRRSNRRNSQSRVRSARVANDTLFAGYADRAVRRREQPRDRPSTSSALCRVPARRGRRARVASIPALGPFAAHRHATPCSPAASGCARRSPTGAGAGSPGRTRPVEPVLPGAGRARAAARVRAGARRRDGRAPPPGAGGPPRTGSLAGQHADGGPASATRTGSAAPAADPRRRSLPGLGRRAARARADVPAPTLLARPRAATTGCGSRRSPGSTSTCSARPSPTGWSVDAGAAGRPAQDRQLHGRPRRCCSARPSPARTPTARRATAYTATARRSARRSSSATTCSGCTATRRSPASRPATTCAPASRPRCSCWPVSSPRRHSDAELAAQPPVAGLPTSPRLADLVDGHRCRRRRWRHMIDDRVDEALDGARRARPIDPCRPGRARPGSRSASTAAWRALIGGAVRTVTGPTDRSSWSAPASAGWPARCTWPGAGRQVTVLEREPVPGGRAGRLTVGGYEFDTGPTVLTMPELIAEALAAVGENLADWLDLTPLDPAYRAYYPDGSTLDVITDTVRMAAEISRVCGPREADGYLRFVDYARRLWQLERADFIERNLDTPDRPAHREPAPAARGGRRSGGSRRRSTSSSATRVPGGSSPSRPCTPAWRRTTRWRSTRSSPTSTRSPASTSRSGGMHAVPRALAGAAEKHGVEIRYGTTVTRVETAAGRATARASPPTASASRPTSWCSTRTCRSPTATCCPAAPAAQPLRYSPSCVVLHVGSRRRYAQDRPPQHPLRTVVEGHLRRGDPTAAS